MHDEEKLKKVSPLLGIDSPMVIHHVDWSRLTDGGTRVVVQGGGTAEPTPPRAEERFFAARCSIFHSPPGTADDGGYVLDDGTWTSTLARDYWGARAVADGHEHSGDVYVALYVGQHFIGPVTARV